VTDSLDYRILVFTPESATVPDERTRQSGQPGTVLTRLHHLFRIHHGPQLSADLDLQSVPAQSHFTMRTRVVFRATRSTPLRTMSANIINGVGNVPEESCAATPNPTNGGAGDPNVYAVPEIDFDLVKLVSRGPGVTGNDISIAATTGTTVTTTSTVTNTSPPPRRPPPAPPLSLRPRALRPLPVAAMRPSSHLERLFRFRAPNLSDNTITTSADGPSANPNDSPLPLELGGVEVYIDGIRVAILGVSPTNVDVQVPFELVDTQQQQPVCADDAQ